MNEYCAVAKVGEKDEDKLRERYVNAVKLCNKLRQWLKGMSCTEMSLGLIRALHASSDMLRWRKS